MPRFALSKSAESNRRPPVPPRLAVWLGIHLCLVGAASWHIDDLIAWGFDGPWLTAAVRPPLLGLAATLGVLVFLGGLLSLGSSREKARGDKPAGASSP
jgi:hypothetical protein